MRLPMSPSKLFPLEFQRLANSFQIGSHMHHAIKYIAGTLSRITRFLSDDQTRYNGLAMEPKRRIRSRRHSNATYQEYEPRRMLAGVLFTPATGEVLIGGTTGNDTVRVTQANQVVTVTYTGFDTRTFDASDVNSIRFIGLAGDDFFQNQTAIPAIALGQAGNDRLLGGTGDDRLVGNTGNDIIRGNGGDDFIVAGNGDDQIDAGNGNDRVLGIRGFNTIVGGIGDDTVFGGLDTDVITDVSGTNVLAGGSGEDRIQGGTGNDLIFGGDGDDILQGLGGNDRIFAQGGNDFLSGGSGVDIVNGNDGNDILQGEQGNDRLIGGTGNDRANFSGELASYEVTGNVNSSLLVNDLRGANFGLEDRVFTVEEFAFADGVRTASGTLTPVVATPSNTARETVFVQPIVAANSNGSNQAEFFGNAAQEADIKNRIDQIFGQADIDIEFLSTRRINDTFTNVGNGTGTRPGADLGRVVSNGDAAGVGNSNRNVIDLYFVERVPGFADVGNFGVNGLAFVGAAGAAVHVGDNLVSSTSGRQTVAEVTAHEIGHNLGLAHVSISNNLLAPSGGGTNLTNSQINTAIRSSLSQPTADTATSATLVQLNPAQADFSQGPNNTQTDSYTSLAGGCGGCGVCSACLGV